MFSAKLIISTGRTNAMFTLRETYQTYMHNEVSISSVYLVNLSTNPDEAFEKATAWSKSSGIELYTTRCDLDEQLREIERMLNGLSKAELKALAEAERQAVKDAQWDEYLHECLAKGVYPFGAHKAMKFADAPRSYITWVLTTEFEVESRMWHVQEAVKPVCSNLVLPKPDPDMIAGTIGKREAFQVQIIRVGGYSSQFGWVNVITMINEFGACLVSKGAFCAEVGEFLNIKGTVKEHTMYKQQVQTVVQRIAVI